MILPEWGILLHMAGGYETRPGATEEDLAWHQEHLRATFPAALRNLYLASDGVYDVRGQWYVVWPLAMLAQRNETWWAEGRRELLCFGDDGTAAPFCVPRDGGPGVFCWNPVDGAPHWLANDVADFWSGWTAGLITT